MKNTKNVAAATKKQTVKPGVAAMKLSAAEQSSATTAKKRAAEGKPVAKPASVDAILAKTAKPKPAAAAYTIGDQVVRFGRKEPAAVKPEQPRAAGKPDAWTSLVLATMSDVELTKELLKATGADVKILAAEKQRRDVLAEAAGFRKQPASVATPATRPENVVANRRMIGTGARLVNGVLVGANGEPVGSKTNGTKQPLKVEGLADGSTPKAVVKSAKPAKAAKSSGAKAVCSKCGRDNGRPAPQQDCRSAAACKARAKAAK